MDLRGQSLAFQLRCVMILAYRGQVIMITYFSEILFRCDTFYNPT